MTTLTKILVATDFSEASDAALAYGRDLAARFNATLDVLHVAENIYVTTFGAENYVGLAPDLQAEIERAARARLEQLVAVSDGSGPRTTPVVITSASPAFAIIDYAGEHGIDLIVMGTHGRGAVAHLVMGSVAEKVVRLAACPVLTVRHAGHAFIRPDTPAVVAHA
jgi:universal stress protein A